MTITQTTNPSPPTTGSAFSLYYQDTTNTPVMNCTSRIDTYSYQLRDSTNNVLSTFYSNSDLITNLNTPLLCTFVSPYVYYIIQGSASIGQYNTNTRINTVFDSLGLIAPVGITSSVSGATTNLYITDGNKVAHISINSGFIGQRNNDYITGLSNAIGIAYYNNSGTEYLFITDAGTYNVYRVALTNLSTLVSIASSTSTPVPINAPYGIAVNNSGVVYVLNNGGSNSSLLSFTNTSGLDYTETVVVSYTTLSSNSFSNGLRGITFDSSNNIYIIRNSGNQIGFYNVATNTFSVYLNTNVSGLVGPCGICIDTLNNMYITNSGGDVPTTGFIRLINGVQYNFNNIIINSAGSNTLNIFNVKTGVTTIPSVVVTVACFLKGTKILCFINDKEQYVKIEDIKENTLIKTSTCGYKKIIGLYHTVLQNTIDSCMEKLYKINKNSNPDLIEDLYLSGGHALLVDELTEHQSNEITKIFGFIPTIANKKALLACLSDDFVEVMDENTYELYHILLEPTDDISHYGIYANGLLTETLPNHVENMTKIF